MHTRIVYALDLGPGSSTGLKYAGLYIPTSRIPTQRTRLNKREKKNETFLLSGKTRTECVQMQD